MVEKRMKTEIDEYGMIEVRTETITFDLLSAKPEDHQAVGEFIQQEDVALVMDMLDWIERDIVEFWTSQGLPAEVNRGDHPARHANAASQLGRSWASWRTLKEARLALAAGEAHRVFRYAWCLATINAEVRMARRRAGRVERARSVGGGEEAAGTKNGQT